MAQRALYPHQPEAVFRRVGSGGLEASRCRAGDECPGDHPGERESALFHLYGAVLGVCHEIAGYYRLPQAAAPRVDALLNAEVLAAAPSPELAELVELASQPETWLGQLLGAYSELFLPPRPTKAAKIDPSTPLIVAVSIDEDAPCFLAKPSRNGGSR